MMPVELVFAEMKMFLKNERRPTNLKELVEGIEAYVRERLTVSKCRSLIRHMRKSMALVVKRKGAAVRGPKDDKPDPE